MKNEDYQVVADVQQMDSQIDKYEDAIITELAAKSEYDKAVEERDKVFAEADEKIVGVRNYVIECIVTEADNAKPMLELAIKIIELEKTNNYFEPENWKAIAHLL